jgi:hypothetical protein
VAVLGTSEGAFPSENMLYYFYMAAKAKAI